MTIREAKQLKKLLDSEDYRIEIPYDILEIVETDLDIEFHSKDGIDYYEDIDVNEVIVTRSIYIENWMDL